MENVTRAILTSELMKLFFPKSHVFVLRCLGLLIEKIVRESGLYLASSGMFSASKLLLDMLAFPQLCMKHVVGKGTWC